MLLPLSIADISSFAKKRATAVSHALPPPLQTTDETTIDYGNFGDQATLRRELVNMGLLGRKSDCSEYWKEPVRHSQDVQHFPRALRLAVAGAQPTKALTALTARHRHKEVTHTTTNNAQHLFRCCREDGCGAAGRDGIRQNDWQQLIRLYRVRIAAIDKAGPKFNSVIEPRLVIASALVSKRKSWGRAGICTAYRSCSRAIPGSNTINWCATTLLREGL